MEPSVDASPRPSLDVSSRIVDGEVVVLDHANERIHHLNATASFVWSRLDGDDPDSIRWRSGADPTFFCGGARGTGGCPSNRGRIKSRLGLASYD